MGHPKGETMKAITRNGSTIDLRRASNADWLRVIKSTDPSVPSGTETWLMGTGERPDQPLSWTGGALGPGWDVVRVVQYRSERLAYKKRGRLVLIGDRTIKRPTMKRCKFCSSRSSTIHLGNTRIDYLYQAWPRAKWTDGVEVFKANVSVFSWLGKTSRTVRRPMADWSRYP